MRIGGRHRRRHEDSRAAALARRYAGELASWGLASAGSGLVLGGVTGRVLRAAAVSDAVLAAGWALEPWLGGGSGHRSLHRRWVASAALDVVQLAVTAILAARPDAVLERLPPGETSRTAAELRGQGLAGLVHTTGLAVLDGRALLRSRRLARASHPDRTRTAQTQRSLVAALGAWSAGSLLVGGAVRAVGRRRASPALAAAGQQTALWGAVDAGITAFGVLRSRGGRVPERDALRRLLAVNAVADVCYVLAGAHLLVRPHAVPDAVRERLGGSDAALRGHGAAVVVQGAFLLVLDSTVALRLR